MKPLDKAEEQLIKNIGTHNPHQISDDLPSFNSNLSFLSNTTSIGLIITDTNGVVITCNEMIKNLLGFELNEDKPSNVSELYAHPNDRKRLLKMLAFSSSVHDFEVELKHKNGTLRTVMANIDSIEWNHEHVLLTSIYDITQYKQRYKMSESRYQSLFSNVPVGITVTDTQGRLIISNNAIKELLGYSEGELKDIKILDFYMVAADREHLLKLTKQFGVVRDFETVFKRKNGSAITVLINTDIIEFNHRKNMLLTSIRDISEHKRIEDELIIERDFSSTVLNIAATLIVVLDRNGVITRFNHTCERLTGYSFKEIKGKLLWDIGFCDPVITQDKIDRLLREDYLGTFNTFLLSKSDKRYSIVWTFATMSSKEGAIEYIVATGVNITEQQRAEAELQQANRELGIKVEELQARTEEMKQLNEMGEQLQNCQAITEVCAISIQYIQKICPISSGALYLINESKDLAEAVGLWGEPIVTKEVFHPLDCWAIRRGHQHLVEDQHPGLLCGHITGHISGQYLCVPLLVNGEAIGILHLNHVKESGQASSDTANSSYAGHKTHIIITIAEHIALALSNLKLRESLRQQSIRDTLTSLFNRRYMEETLERELKRSQRENRPISVIMFDIDHFKLFNDTAGHDAGDALLRALGLFLKKSSRGGDIVCRYGGDEFLAVLPDTDLESAVLHAEKLRQGVKELSVSHLGKILTKCSISLGIAVSPENGLESEALLKSVDNALYRAKNEGRDQVVQA